MIMPTIIITCITSHKLFNTTNCFSLYTYPNSKNGIQPTQYITHIASDSPAASFVE